MVTKFFRNSNFSDFLGIKSEISHYISRSFMTIRVGKLASITSDLQFRIRIFRQITEKKKIQPETNLEHPEPIIQR